jgi:hypothetical protein
LGLLALQNGFLGRDELLAGFAAWVADKSRPLDRILVDRGSVDEPRRALLETLADEHLRRHGDTEASLADVSSLGPPSGELERLSDYELQASLAATTAQGAGDDGATTDEQILQLDGAPDRLAVARVQAAELFNL